MSSVALIVLDTLRKDAFDEHFDWLPGRQFDNAISTSHWTAPVHASMFAGRYPSELGVVADAPSLNCPESTLAEQLTDAGYTTRAFSSNPYVSKTFNFDRGFQHFDGSWRLDGFDPDLFDWNRFIDETREMGVRRFPLAAYRCVTSDCDILRSLRYGVSLKLRDAGIGSTVNDDGANSTLSYVRDTTFGDDEFLFVNLMEAHAPYKPPEEYRTTEVPDFDNTLATVRGTDVDPETVRGAYDDAVRYLSDVYADIFDELRDSFDVVITVADHGELFGEHDVWEHVYGVSPELVRVPLVVSGDGYSETVTETVSLLDVYSTVLDATGLSINRRGESLLGTVTDRTALSEYHGLQPRKREKLRKADVPDRTVRHYDECRNGIGFESGYYGWETLEGFEEVGDPGPRDPESSLEEVRSSLERRSIEKERDLSDAVEAQLEDLGYA
jgi:arylsulfatase A-like enzyme